MNNLGNKHSGMAEVFSVGRSYEGREQLAIKVELLLLSKLPLMSYPYLKGLFRAFHGG